MDAEIIAIGSELTSGAKLDTNSQWLSCELAAVGIPVRYHSTVADTIDALTAVLRTAVNRSDLVLITGGLGPTLDDLTRHALAQLMQTELVLHEPSLEFIRSLFTRRRRAMPERNTIQAMFPVGSEPLSNPLGTAPGILVRLSRKAKTEPSLLIAMPGVPSEMKRMFRHEVLPRLPHGAQVIREARIHCFGAGESSIEEMLGDLTTRDRNPEVGITAHEATITLRIRAHGRTIDQCDEQIAVAKTVVRETLGDLVFGEEDEELQDVLVALLQERGQTVATVETVTGGLLAACITSADRSETCYLGGLVLPAVSESNPTGLAGFETSPRLGENVNKVPDAGSLAVMCRERFGSDFALAVTDVGGSQNDLSQENGSAPSTERETLSAGQTANRNLQIALAGENLREIRPHRPVGDPAIARSRATKAAMNLLRLHLIR